jgi:hypothetical protein
MRGIELRWQVWLPWLALMGILLSATRTDPDLWGHVRFGLDWLATWRLPTVDPYSFTQDRPWVNHEWLSEVLMGAAYLLGRPAGLVVLKMLVVSGALVVLCLRLRGTSPVTTAAVMTLAVVGALPVTATVRPQLWSLLGLVLLVPLLDFEPPTPRRMLIGGALFALWANLHGGWITGAGVLAIHIIVRVFRAPGQARAWVGFGLACLGGTLINPYGIGLWRFLSSTVRTSRPDISEWGAFSADEPALMWVSVAGPILILAAVSLRRPSRPPLETLAAVGLLVVAGLRISRVAPLVCPAALALLAPSVAAATGHWARLTAPGRGAAAVLFAPSVLALLAAWTPMSRVMTCLPTRDVWAPDMAAAASLKGRQGRLWTTFNWGQYAIWHFGPALKVSIDGRRETVYSDAVLQWHRDVEDGNDNAIGRMIAVSPDYVWLPAARDATVTALVGHGYRVDVRGPASLVLARPDHARLPTSITPLPACFP